MSEFRQYHSSLKISRIKELPQGNFVVIGDSVQDVVILQSGSKMKAALGKNVTTSLPKAFQTSKVQAKSLAIKRVPTDITDTEFIEFLDLNKISYAKAERLKSKKDNRIFSIFRLKINHPTEAEAHICQTVLCQVTGIVYKVQKLRSPVSVTQCFSCKSLDIRLKTVGPNKNVLSAVSTILTKDPNKEVRKPKCANCKWPHVKSYNGFPEYKKQAFRQHVVNNQKTYAATLSQNTLRKPKTNITFTFRAEQLTKFVANVVIQIAQPQVCYPNPKQDMLDLKSSMCRKKFPMPSKQY